MTEAEISIRLLEEVPCGLCGHDDPRIILVEDGLRVVACRRCGFVYVSPRAPTAALIRYYAQEWSANLEADISMQRSFRAGIFDECLLRVESYHAPGRMLDVGCYYGEFLAKARDAGWDTIGVEISRRSSEYARAQLGLNVITGTLHDAAFEDESFDVVTLWEVLEHLPHPLAELKEIYRILKPGGLLAVRVPNLIFQLPKARVYRLTRHLGIMGPDHWGRCVGLDPRGHLHQFVPRTLWRMMEIAGFWPLDIRIGACALNPGRSAVFNTFKQGVVSGAEMLRHSMGLNLGNLIEGYATKLCESA